MMTDRIAKACPHGILIADKSGRIAWVNEAAGRMFGWQGDKLIGKPVSTLVPPGKRRRHAQLMRALRLKEGRLRQMADWRVVEAQRRDGTRFPISIWLAPERFDGEERVIAFMQDMSVLVALQSAAAEADAKLAAEREQTAMLALVAEYATDSVIITDAAGYTLWVNRATEKLTGYQADEFLGRKPGDLLQGPETDQAVVRQISKAVHAGRGIRCELLNYSKTGESYWIDMNVAPIHGADGVLDKFIAVERDVTEAMEQRRALEEATQAARDAERRLNAAIESLSDGFVIYDAQDRLVTCNAAFRNFHDGIDDIIAPGVTFSELVLAAARRGYFDTEGFSPEAWTRRQVEMRKASDFSETLVRLTDGRWMLRRERRTSQGEMIGSRSDITQFKEQEAALREAKRTAERAEARLASAIEAISEGFVIYDEYDRLVMCNSAYKQMRAEDADLIQPGVTFEELVRTAVERGHFDTDGEDPDEWVKKQVEARKAGTDVETMVRFTDGRWMLRRERRTPQGEMIGIRSDITAFKQQEAALEEARERAEAADRAKSEFVANISHELRTPINGIMGFNQLMLAGELSDKQRERAEIIKASSEHLLQIVNDLLDLSRITSNSVELEPEPFDVAELVEESVELMTPLARDKGISLKTSVETLTGARLNGDRSRIKQILLNLMGNAIKFTAEGHVRLSARPAAGGIAFDVADTGEGMPEDQLQQIFERFAQIKSKLPGANGAGLGLAITKGLVDLMSGEVDVHSELGHGSTFTVRLPLPLMGPDRPSRSSSPRKKKAARNRRTQMYDVLVAEDHPFNQVLISEILDSIGCRVTMVPDGQQAVDEVENHAFDLIIMDNQMPVMSGLKAIDHIRGRDDWKTRIPILALTANAMRGAEKDYEAYGVEEFMTKPLDVNRVIETVKRLGDAGHKIRREASAEVE
jgi:PAS domain S-box-containing protein